MTPISAVTMVLVCGIVWGGFAYILTKAVRKEGGKAGEGSA